MGIKTTKKHIILAGETLSKIPTFTNPDLQIESYPGAYFRHMHAILQMLTSAPNHEVEHLILAIGINTR